MSWTLVLAAYLSSQPCPVKLGAVTVQGYDKDMLRLVARRHRDELCTCARGAPELVVELRYVIDSHGDVPWAVANDASGAVGKCFAKVVQTWQFPGQHPCGVAQVDQRIRVVP